MIGAAQLPCEYYVVAVVADDVLDGEPTRYQGRVLLVSDGFVVRSETIIDEAEMRQLGADLLGILRRERTEVSFLGAGGSMYLHVGQHSAGEMMVAGRILREGGAWSVFQTRTDRHGLETFVDGLRQFPHGE